MRTPATRLRYAVSELIPPPEQCLVAVIDVQERLCQAMADAASVVPRITKCVQAAAELSVDIAVTEQYPKGLGSTVAPLSEVLAAHGVAPWEKTSFSCWGCAGWAAAVGATGCQCLVLVGMEPHVCVQQTALDALARGYRVILPADAICSRHPTDRALALDLLRSQGTIVTTVEALAFAWLADAANPAFKRVSALFK